MHSFRGITSGLCRKVKSFSTTAEKFVTKSRYPLPALESSIVNKPLPQFILDTFLQPERKHELAIVDGSTHKSLTFNEAYNGCYSLADSLKDFGVKKDDVVAIMSPNHLYYMSMFLSIPLVGGISTPINPLYSEKEIDYQLDVTNANVIFVHPICVDKVLNVVENRRKNKEHKDNKGNASEMKVIVIDLDLPAEHTKALQKHNNNNNNNNIHYLSQLLTTQSISYKYDHNAYLATIHDPENLVTLPFSSGTTGRSKGVMLTHKNIIINILQIIEMEGKHLQATSSNKQGRLLIPLPFFHIYGLTAGMLMPIYIGAQLIFLPQFELSLFLQTIERYRITRSFVVPPIVLQLAKHPSVSQYDLTSLQCLMSGAAPLGSELQCNTAKRLNCIVKQTWGMTELSPVGTITPDDLITSMESLQGTAGQLLPETEAKVINVHTGESVPYHTEGELLLRGPQVMKGYLHEPEATRNTITEDGWLHTGDIATIDEEGWIYLKDRMKELIKYKGFPVPPADLEALIATMPQVKDVIVIPIPDEEAGEVPRAYVVKQETNGSTNSDAVVFTEQDVIDFVYQHVAPHKRLRGGVVFVESVPKSPSGKLLRRLQIEKDKQLFPELYANN